MITVTFDTNCIIDLEEQRPAASALRQILEVAREGRANVAVVAASASEVQPGGGASPSFSVFQAKLVRAGLDDCEALKPIGYFDLTYWDWCLISDDKMEALARAIHAILFPGSPFDPQLGGQDRAWRNRRCDVLAMWCHIYYGRRMFVTSDVNFIRKQAELRALGCPEVRQPVDAAGALV